MATNTHKNINIDNESVFRLDLPIGILGSLCRAGIITVGELKAAMTNDSLSRISHFGENKRMLCFYAVKAFHYTPVPNIGIERLYIPFESDVFNLLRQYNIKSLNMLNATHLAQIATAVNFAGVNFVYLLDCIRGHKVRYRAAVPTVKLSKELLRVSLHTLRYFGVSVKVFNRIKPYGDTLFDIVDTYKIIASDVADIDPDKTFITALVNYYKLSAEEFYETAFTLPQFGNTREQVCQLTRQTKTYQELAEEMNVSKERVRQRKELCDGMIFEMGTPLVFKTLSKYGYLSKNNIHHTPNGDILFELAKSHTKLKYYERIDVLMDKYGASLIDEAIEKAKGMPTLDQIALAKELVNKIPALDATQTAMLLNKRNGGRTVSRDDLDLFIIGKYFPDGITLSTPHCGKGYKQSSDFSEFCQYYEQEFGIKYPRIEKRFITAMELKLIMLGDGIYQLPRKTNVAECDLSEVQQYIQHHGIVTFIDLYAAFPELVAKYNIDNYDQFHGYIRYWYPEYKYSAGYVKYRVKKKK